MLWRKIEQGRWIQRHAQLAEDCSSLTIQFSGAPPCFWHKGCLGRDGNLELELLGDKQEMNWSKRCILSMLTQSEDMLREGRREACPSCHASWPRTHTLWSPSQGLSPLQHASVSIFLPLHSTTYPPEFLRCPDGCSGELPSAEQSLLLTKLHQQFPRLQPNHLALLAKGSPAFCHHPRAHGSELYSMPNTILATHGIVSHASFLEGRGEEGKSEKGVYLGAGPATKDRDCQTVVLKLNDASQSPSGLLPQTFLTHLPTDSVDLWWGPRICLSNSVSRGSWCCWPWAHAEIHCSRPTVWQAVCPQCPCLFLGPSFSSNLWTLFSLHFLSLLGHLCFALALSNAFELWSEKIILSCKWLVIGTISSRKIYMLTVQLTPKLRKYNCDGGLEGSASVWWLCFGGSESLK